MAGRKAQHDADYFPFFAKDGRTLFMLQSKFGLEGIGFFTNLLRLLCTTEHHFLDLSDPIEAAYTWSKIGLQDKETSAEKMVHLMVATGKLDRKLWEKCRVIYCQDFVDSLDELYAKRKEKPLSVEQIWETVSISAPEIEENDNFRPGNTAYEPISAPEIHGNPIKPTISGESIRKGKESRVKESKEEFAEAENPAPETFDREPDKHQTPPDDPDPQPSRPTADDFDPTPPGHGLKTPENLKLSPKDLDELQARFGSRSQEALDAIGLCFAAKDWGYKNHWAGAKTWFAKEASALAWLDKQTGKKPGQVQPQKAVDTRGFNEPPAPPEERVDLAGFSPEDFTHRSKETA